MKTDLHRLQRVAGLLIVILVLAATTLASFSLMTGETEAKRRTKQSAAFDLESASDSSVAAALAPQPVHPVPVVVRHPVVQTVTQTGAFRSERETSAKAAPPEPAANIDQDNPQPVVKSGDPDGTLIIPKIDIHHQTVNLPFVDGQWQTDDLGSDIGRLEGTGRFPQDDQAMVFAAHYTIYWPVSGPFIDLEQLMPNDEIIYIENGQKYVYNISQLAYVDPDQVDLLFRDNGDQIVLLTCSQFNLLSGHFDKRLLVIADLAEIQAN